MSKLKFTQDAEGGHVKVSHIIDVQLQARVALPAPLSGPVIQPNVVQMEFFVVKHPIFPETTPDERERIGADFIAQINDARARHTLPALTMAQVWSADLKTLFIYEV